MTISESDIEWKLPSSESNVCCQSNRRGDDIAAFVRGFTCATEYGGQCGGGPRTFRAFYTQPR